MEPRQLYMWAKGKFNIHAKIKKTFHKTNNPLYSSKFLEEKNKIYIYARSYQDQPYIIE